MKKTGELLKQKRESSSLSLSEVALATKINPKVLTAIENGDESNLPAKTFLKGFVRSYALFLKMDVEEVLRCFVEDTGGPPPTQTHEAYQRQDGATSARRSVSHEGSSGLRTVAVVVIVFLIVAIIGVRELVDKYQRERMAASTPADVKVSPLAEPKTESRAQAKVEPKPEIKAEPKVDVKPARMVEVAAIAGAPAALMYETARTESPFQSRFLASTDRPALMSIAKDLPKALDAPVETVRAIAQQPAEAAADAPTAPKAEVKAEAKAEERAPANGTATEAAPAPTAVAPTATSIKNEVIIEALDQVQVKIQLGSETKTVALAPNDIYTLRSEGAIALDVSDGGAVSLVHNGRVQGVPGKLGEPKQVKIP